MRDVAITLAKVRRAHKRMNPFKKYEHPRFYFSITRVGICRVLRGAWIHGVPTHRADHVGAFVRLCRR